MTYFEAMFFALLLTPIVPLSLSLFLPVALLEKLLPGPKARPREELQHRHIQASPLAHEVGS